MTFFSVGSEKCCGLAPASHHSVSDKIVAFRTHGPSLDQSFNFSALTGCAQAAGVDVVVTMETISWDCESDCWLAQEFLWQNKDWKFVGKFKGKQTVDIQ
jgi:hypothetical protein